MKSAGKRRSNSSPPRSSSGWNPHCAKGIAPESYQASITSGTRRASAPHAGHGNAISSIVGRCGSRSAKSRPASELELGERAHGGRVALRASPDRERRSPVPLAGQCPVDVVLEPVPVPAALDVVRVPVDLVVHLEQALLHRGRPHVPRGSRVVEEWRRAPPAERVGVLDRARPLKEAALPEVHDDRRVGVLHEHPSDERGAEVREPAIVAHGLEHGPALREPELEVRGAERRRHVDDPGPVLQRHERAGDDAMCVLDVGVGRVVPRVFEGPTFHRALVGPTLRAQRRRAGVGHDQPLLAEPKHGVRRRGVHGHAGVRGQRPRGGRPHEERRPDQRRIEGLDDRERTSMLGSSAVS